MLPAGIYLNQAADLAPGTYQTPKLPNIRGTCCAGVDYPVGSYSGAFALTNILSASRQGGATATNKVVQFDAALAEQTYCNLANDDANKVLTRAVQCPFYVCLANVSVPASEVQYQAFLQEMHQKPIAMAVI